MGSSVFGGIFAYVVSLYPVIEIMQIEVTLSFVIVWGTYLELTNYYRLQKYDICNILMQHMDAIYIITIVSEILTFEAHHAFHQHLFHLWWHCFLLVILHFIRYDVNHSLAFLLIPEWFILHFIRNCHSKALCNSTNTSHMKCLLSSMCLLLRLLSSMCLLLRLLSSICLLLSLLSNMCLLLRLWSSMCLLLRLLSSMCLLLRLLSSMCLLLRLLSSMCLLLRLLSSTCLLLRLLSSMCLLLRLLSSMSSAKIII